MSQTTDIVCDSQILMSLYLCSQTYHVNKEHYKWDKYKNEIVEALVRIYKLVIFYSSHETPYSLSLKNIFIVLCFNFRNVLENLFC